MKKLSFIFKYNLPPELRRKKKPKDIPIKKYPLMPIKLYLSNKKTSIIEGLIDSGSNGLFIPKSIAEFLNLSKGKKIDVSGICGNCKAYETKVGLILGRGGREVNFGYIKAVFPEEERNIPILIGREPVFDEYQIIFEEHRERFKLIPKEEI